MQSFSTLGEDLTQSTSDANAPCAPLFNWRQKPTLPIWLWTSTRP